MDGCLRLATIGDREILFQWANDPITRANAFHSQPISWQEHCHWLDNSLANPDCILYVYLWKETPIGQIRFDILDSMARIDYSLDPLFRGKGHGKTMLNQALIQLSQMRPDVLGFLAEVKPFNYASQRIFEQTGFSKKDGTILQYKKLISTM